MEQVDLIIVGAGAAGLFCAGSARAGGRRIVVLDHARKAGEKIRISGGGRCNFTNLNTSRERFLSQNPRFAASALARFSAEDFVALVDQAGISWHEKTLGQLFCDGRSTQITDMLLRRAAGAELWLETKVLAVSWQSGQFEVTTSRGALCAKRLVVATGGKSIPKMGATGFAYDLARQFGLEVTPTRPGLVPLMLGGHALEAAASLSGIALDAEISHRGAQFRDALLFTHRGLSGPVILQISSFWRDGESLTVDLLPGTDIAAALKLLRRQAGRGSLRNAVARWLPARLADSLSEQLKLGDARLADTNDARLDQVAMRIHRWQINPSASEGYRTAEVTVGGVDTGELESRTMEARKLPGLYFIGECVDVTGWLGGYNFQWAWASADAAGRAIAAEWHAA